MVGLDDGFLSGSRRALGGADGPGWPGAPLFADVPSPPSGARYLRRTSGLGSARTPPRMRTTGTRGLARPRRGRIAFCPACVAPALRQKGVCLERRCVLTGKYTILSRFLKKSSWPALDPQGLQTHPPNCVTLRDAQDLPCQGAGMALLTGHSSTTYRGFTLICILYF